MRFLVLFLIFFQFFGCCNVLQGTDFSIKQAEAEEAFQALLFDKAADLFQELLDDPEANANDNQTIILLWLAQSLYGKGDYAAAIALLEPNLAVMAGYMDDFAYRMGLFLLGLSYTKLCKYPEAIQSFETYLRHGDKSHLEFYDAALFELGTVFFRSGQILNAKNVLASISWDDSPFELVVHARLLLAHIMQNEGNLKDAEKILNELELKLPKDHHLLRLVLYWHGDLLYQLQDYLKAASTFERSLSETAKTTDSLSDEALFRVGCCYLNLAENDDAQRYLEKGGKIFQHLLEKGKTEERTYLALAQVHLTKSTRFDDQAALVKAKQLLENDLLLSTVEGQAQSLLLRAQSAAKYQERAQLYNRLIQDCYKQTTVYSTGWYYRGTNEYLEAKALIASKKEFEAQVALVETIASFQRAFELLKDFDKVQAASAAALCAEACWLKHDAETCRQAFTMLDMIIQNYPDILSAVQEPAEFYYLHALIAAHLAKIVNETKFTAAAEKTLQQGLEAYPVSPMKPKLQFLLGLIAYQNKHFEQALQIFIDISKKNNNIDLNSEALFWSAKCADALNPGCKDAQIYRRQVFETYPQSPFAAEAYFFYYPYKEYLQGERAAIKHLQAMPDKFSDSPYLINAFYLIGIDFKRDRKTPDGKWIRKRNMNEAINALYQAEETFDRLYAKNLIPDEELRYFINVRYRTILERALANIAIVDESQGAKRRIFLEYAIEVLEQMIGAFKALDHPLTKQLLYQEPYPRFLEEGMYCLAQAYVRMLDDRKAEAVLSEMLEKYRTVKITRGYFLSRAWYERSMIAMRRNEYALALEYLNYAEDAGKGRILSTDQKIDGWIQQSLCLQALNEMDKAMLVLSKAINDDAISSLRVKAMYLRAEIYEKQARPELARKQLEATAKKGGDWAIKAKQKLVQNYGY